MFLSERAYDRHRVDRIEIVYRFEHSLDCPSNRVHLKFRRRLTPMFRTCYYYRFSLPIFTRSTGYRSYDILNRIHHIVRDTRREDGSIDR